MRIAELRNFVDKTVTLHMKDGEVAVVRITFLDEQDGDLTAAIVESSSPDHERAPCALHTFAAGDIESIELFGSAT